MKLPGDPDEDLAPFSRALIRWGCRHPVEAIGGLFFGLVIAGIVLGWLLVIAATRHH